MWLFFCTFAAVKRKTSMLHHDENTARRIVIRYGEHYDINQVLEIIRPQLAIIGEEDTIWDFYVALNIAWRMQNDSRE